MLINAFIPAAGLGERLRPVTLTTPKPLLPIMGVPVIERVVERLSTLPLKGIGVNAHHLAGRIREWGGRSRFSRRITIFDEETILGTGGALRNASSLLKERVFVVHNSDILSDIDLPALVDRHLHTGNLATLAIHDHERFNNLLIGPHGELTGIAGGTKPSLSGQRMAFTGIAVYSAAFLDLLPEGVSSVVDAWLRAVATGHVIGTMDFTGCSWSDIGTPAAYAAAAAEQLRKEGEQVFVHPSADCTSIDADGFVSIEGPCEISGMVSLRNVVVLPGALLREGERIENAILGPGFSVAVDPCEVERLLHAGARPGEGASGFVGEFFGIPSSELSLEMIGAGGSDRRYWRARNGRSAAVLVECSEGDPDLRRQIEYTSFFRGRGLPVPELLSSDPDRGVALLEDLGDRSLYSWLRCGRKVKEIEEMYAKVLSIAARLHSLRPGDLAGCPLLCKRVFDYDHFRWESGYFLDRFVRGLRGQGSPAGLLDREFDVLARTADAFDKRVVHRDFQSQNVMVALGEPRLIDYQGARMGPPAYDIASMLWDPYYLLEGAMRDRLIDRYMEERRTLDPLFDDREFRESLLPCRIQRHLQALGAYAFLSEVKGKTYFRKHIPRALEYLSTEAEILSDRFPLLADLVRELTAGRP